MKIAFFISAMGHGSGGHFHSLNHISQVLGNYHNVKIISFGPGRSKIIESNPYFCKHINFNGINLISFYRNIKLFSKEFDPDIYHCFDEECYNLIRIIISSRTHRIILNRCGGQNPIGFPHAYNLILFSYENYEWFRKQKRYNSSNVVLVPNRVKPIELDRTYNPISKQKAIFNFLRICRINSLYEKSIRDSFNLIKYLHSRNIRVAKLYIVGVIEDKEVYQDLAKHPFVRNGNIVFLNDSIYTTEASRMLYLADAVIGSGRGIMEAASLGLPILAINAKGEIPVLLNEANFCDAFKTNFSSRNVFRENNEDINKENIIRMIIDNKFYSELSRFSKDVFDKYFDVNKAKEKYEEVYRNSENGRRFILSDRIYIIKTFYHFYFSNQTK